MKHAFQRLNHFRPAFLPVLALGFVLAACTGYTPPNPTDTPAPTRTRRPPDTPIPSQTPLPQDSTTDTPLPTLEVETVLTESGEETVEPGLHMGEAQDVVEGGFTFQPVVGYDVNLLPNQATLVSNDGGVVLSLTGGDVPGASDLQGLMDRLLSTISEDFEKFESGDSYPVVVDQAQGLASDISAELIGRSISGKVTIAAPTESHLFYAFAFTIQEPENRWESEGSEVFDAVLNSIQFSEIDE